MLPEGYSWYLGLPQDRDHLQRWLKLSYQEAFPQQDSWDHLEATVKQLYDPPATPCWWIMAQQLRVGCIWLGPSTNQVTSQRTGYIFLLRVAPEYRRQGLGRSLVQKGETWAMDAGLEGLQLHMFIQNNAALQLYTHMGFAVQGYWLTKDWESHLRDTRSNQT